MFPRVAPGATHIEALRAKAAPRNALECEVVLLILFNANSMNAGNDDAIKTTTGTENKV